MSEDDRPRAVADLMSLWVHDLRNPVATISANLSFVREVLDTREPDAKEALDDVESALGDLMRGLDQLSWIGRWLQGQDALEPAPGDVRAAVQAALRRVEVEIHHELPASPLEVEAGGTALTRLVELLIRNALTFAGPSSVAVTAYADGPSAVIEVRDDGRALGEDVRDRAFSPDGQHELKGRADGRYSRVTGLFAARTLADALGAELTAGGADGAALFRIRLPRV